MAYRTKLGGQSRREAMNMGEASVQVSFVPLLILYYSFVVPLVLGPFGESIYAPCHCLTPIAQLTEGSGAASTWRSAEGAEGKLAGQSANQSVFGRFHPPSRAAVPIIVAEQMQHAVHDIADQFALPSCVETASLVHRFVEADKDFPVQARLVVWFHVVEGN